MNNQRRLIKLLTVTEMSLERNKKFTAIFLH